MTDPRIQQRRVKVARDKGRLRRRVLLGLVALLVLVGGGLALLHSSLLGAHHVEVEGDVHTSYPSVVSAAGLEGAPPLADLSAAGIAKKVETLPWVERATVTISYPSTVRIHLSERTPVAVVDASAGGFAVVDRTGRVLEDTASRPAGFPFLSDPAGAPAPGRLLGGQADALAGVAAVMPESMVQEVTLLAWGKEGIEAKLSDGLVALFGSPAEAGEKFVSLATVLARADLSGTATIDLRVPADPALLSKASSPIVARNVGG